MTHLRSPQDRPCVTPQIFNTNIPPLLNGHLQFKKMQILLAEWVLLKCRAMQLLQLCIWNADNYLQT